MDTATQFTIFATGEQLGALISRVTQVTEGATVFYGRGLWTDDNGETADEPTAMIVVIEPDRERHEPIRASVQMWLNESGQTAALLTEAEVGQRVITRIGS